MLYNIQYSIYHTMSPYLPSPLSFHPIPYHLLPLHPSPSPPYPRRQDKAATKPLYLWRAVPPSADFVSLGMVATATEEPPPLSSSTMACLPRRWCVARPDKPKLVFKEEAGSGRTGTIWTSGSQLQTMVASLGEDVAVAQVGQHRCGAWIDCLFPLSTPHLAPPPSTSQKLRVTPVRPSASLHAHPGGVLPAGVRPMVCAAGSTCGHFCLPSAGGTAAGNSDATRRVETLIRQL